MLGARGRLAEVLVLVGGFVLIYVGVHVTKAGDRPPAPGGAAHRDRGLGLPERPRRLRDRLGRGGASCSRAGCGLASAALVTGAVVLAAAVGLSRIYLHAHYWSDVAAGWGLGVGIFGLLAAIAHGRRAHAPQ